MMRKLFDEELEKLNVDLTKMGHLVELAIENMIDAFKHQDKTLAKEIITNDRLINDMERTVESRAFNLILRQQPIATDLRNVTTALKIVTDLERIGDQAADIAEIISLVTNSKDIAVIIEGKHSCMSSRGIKKVNSTTVTSTLTGRFKTDSKLQIYLH